ncbi:MAG: phytanoyl-CoA dioxygenase family protein [SAR202 cluster bacterium]|nr:phytanoyl-CoA dioxygenase family protein [SAR202 cluster bacterium]
MAMVVRRTARSVRQSVPRGLEYRLKILWRYTRNMPNGADASATAAKESGRYVEELRQNGFVVIPDLIDPDKVTAMAAAWKNELSHRDRLIPLLKLTHGDNAPSELLEAGYDVNKADVLLKDPMTVFSGYAEFALNDTVLRIVNSYFGRCCALYDCIVWRNPVNDLAPLGSFLWHRDPEGPFLVKSFLYMNDVDEEAAHFVYARGSHTMKFQALKTKHRLTNEEMERIVPRDQWVRLLGKAGTLILADTSGFHKGEKPRSKERNMVQGVYTLVPPEKPVAVNQQWLGDLTPAQTKALRFVQPF